ncbi:MAG: hypothetical protein P4L41_04285 [Flavipsychrobacter sp.]|nr:hypothetical protein [Flavipsychrobacter sp.]
MRLYAIAYPQLAANDLELIQKCRKENNRLYGLIDPHFTFIFMVSDQTISSFTAEVTKRLRDVKRIHFTLRCATINKDAFSGYYFAFLIPDEGHSSIKKLHDKLYSYKLSNHHRLDIDYIPHIEIANSLDKIKIKQLVDQWNETDFAITGTIAYISIITFENGILETVAAIPLK